MSHVRYCNECWNTFELDVLTVVGNHAYCPDCLPLHIPGIPAEESPDPNTGRNDSGRGARPIQGKPKRASKETSSIPITDNPSAAQKHKATKLTSSGGSQIPS